MSKIRALHQKLQLFIVILLTLGGHHFYQKWRMQQIAQEIVTACQLPALPRELHVLHAAQDGNDVALSLSGPADEFDLWMNQLDHWKANQPSQLLNFSIRESEKSLRIDFSAELSK